MENYGLIVRELRTRAKLSIRTAAEKLGRSTGWLSEIENGKPLNFFMR
jgi:transcriptional regulator with XRE-family HTH domain